MRSYIFIFSLIVFGFLFTGNPVSAQEQVIEEEKPTVLDNPQNRKHIAKLNLLSLLNKSVTVSYEQGFSQQKSLQISASYGQSRFWNDASRLAVTPEFRWYLSGSKNALVGFYTGPYLKYQSITDRAENVGGETTSTATYRTFGGGWLLGKQWIAEKGFTVDIFAGAGYNPVVNQLRVEVQDTTVPHSFSADDWRFDVRLGLGIGWAF